MDTVGYPVVQSVLCAHPTRFLKRVRAIVYAHRILDMICMSLCFGLDWVRDFTVKIRRLIHGNGVLAPWLIQNILMSVTLSHLFAASRRDVVTSRWL